ncbi:MAG: class I SAM-dependent methyltransferase [Deltaproteobacteria bacterium]|nr:class I SAM-dependent methyltransferase [Deltaproteobacteria bacterium]
MGLIFDRKSADAYDTWYRSRQGQEFDRSLGTILPRFLDPKAGDRVLDIGCGSGNHLLLLNRLGLDISGMDASSHMIQRAKERLGNRCTLKLGMAEDLPFDDNEFDYAVMIHTLEFLDDPLPAIREAGRVARQKVLVGVMNTLSCDGVKRRIQGYFGDPLFRHARFFNLWEIKSFLRMAYGPVPLSWSCIPPIMGQRHGASLGQASMFAGKYLPFASFLCLSATLVYTVKTQNMPLKTRLKEAGHGVIGAKAFQDLRPFETDIYCTRQPMNNEIELKLKKSLPFSGKTLSQKQANGMFLKRRHFGPGTGQWKCRNPQRPESWTTEGA